MKKKNTALKLAILNAIALIATVVVNALSNILPLNGLGAGQISDLYPNLFVPAGLTFSIWGIIYLLLAGFVIFQFVTVFSKSRSDASIKQIGLLFGVSSLANIGWIFAWHWRYEGVSFLLMLILLTSLLWMYLRLKIGKSKTSAIERYLVRLPISVYLGWITVATIANATALLVDLGWSSFGDEAKIWTVVVMVVAMLIAGAMLLTRRDEGYALVVVWAFFGIYLKRSEALLFPARPVQITAIIGMILIGIGVVLSLALKASRRTSK